VTVGGRRHPGSNLGGCVDGRIWTC
jgi:hypothetical protein